eukprot:gene26366-biopygen22700
MDPLFCIVVVGLDPFCNPQIGEVIMFPMFHHLGNNMTSPEVCNCQTLTVADLASPTHDCNVFRFLSGFLCSNNPFDIWSTASQFTAEPYGPLVQNYQQCTYDTLTRLQNQARIAVGNIQIVAPLCAFFLMIITWLHKWWNKIKTSSFHDKESIIALITDELGEHMMLSAVSHKSHHS